MTWVLLLLILERQKQNQFPHSKNSSRVRCLLNPYTPWQRLSKINNPIQTLACLYLSPSIYNPCPPLLPDPLLSSKHSGLLPVPWVHQAYPCVRVTTLLFSWPAISTHHHHYLNFPLPESFLSFISLLKFPLLADLLWSYYVFPISKCLLLLGNPVPVLFSSWHLPYLEITFFIDLVYLHVPIGCEFWEYRGLIYLFSWLLGDKDSTFTQWMKEGKRADG
jgi:hypothetical protein